MTLVPRSALARLTDGPVPVEDIADQAIQALRDTGATIERCEDGYRLSGLSYGGAAVAAHLDAPYEIEWVETVESTNQLGRRRGFEGHTDRVVLAAEQTGGRGRRDRDWLSPAGGVWLSLVLEPTLKPDRRALLTFAAAVGVVDAAAATGVTAQIKWPNDVVIPDPETDRKVGGILTEVKTSEAGAPFAVVGVGINADVDPAVLPRDATSLRAVTDTVDRATVATTVIETVHELRGDPDRILDRWQGAARTLGQRVRITTESTELEGTAVDITETGALLVDDGTTHHEVTVGDCEHLRPT
ncbi:MAG: biotin--[acetyl-CoA-carboxylase] ligase [Halobacteriaceae archaeon]